MVAALVFMPPVVTATASPASAASAKSDFVNRARDFAKRLRNLPGLPLIGAASSAAAVIATIAGAFGTDGIPVVPRLLFWTLLIGFNTMLWLCWFAWRVKGPDDWWRAALIGSVVVNLPLPAEIVLMLRLVGGAAPSDWHATWLHAAGVSFAILLVVVTGSRMLRTPRRAPQAKGRLWRAGFRNAASIAAIASEDHYCRIWTADGSTRLVHGRFGDLINELEGVDGAVVRRGHWVAASAVSEIRREGRAWSLVLADGREVRIAASSLAELRSRGWLSNQGAARAAALTPVASAPCER